MKNLFIAIMESKILFFGCFLFTCIEGLTYKCGEEIVIHRGERKNIKFWSNAEIFMKSESVDKNPFPPFPGLPLEKFYSDYDGVGNLAGKNFENLKISAEKTYESGIELPPAEISNNEEKIFSYEPINEAQLPSHVPQQVQSNEKGLEETEDMTDNMETQKEENSYVSILEKEEIKPPIYQTEEVIIRKPESEDSIIPQFTDKFLPIEVPDYIENPLVEEVEYVQEDMNENNEIRKTDLDSKKSPSTSYLEEEEIKVPLNQGEEIIIGKPVHEDSFIRQPDVPILENEGVPQFTDKFLLNEVSDNIKEPLRQPPENVQEELTENNELHKTDLDSGKNANLEGLPDYEEKTTPLKQTVKNQEVHERVDTIKKSDNKNLLENNEPAVDVVKTDFINDEINPLDNIIKDINSEANNETYNNEEYVSTTVPYVSEDTGNGSFSDYSDKDLLNFENEKILVETKTKPELSSFPIFNADEFISDAIPAFHVSQSVPYTDKEIMRIIDEISVKVNNNELDEQSLAINVGILQNIIDYLNSDTHYSQEKDLSTTVLNLESQGLFNENGEMPDLRDDIEIVNGDIMGLTDTEDSDSVVEEKVNKPSVNLIDKKTQPYIINDETEKEIFIEDKLVKLKTSGETMDNSNDVIENLELKDSVFSSGDGGELIDTSIAIKEVNLEANDKITQTEVKSQAVDLDEGRVEELIHELNVNEPQVVLNAMKENTVLHDELNFPTETVEDKNKNPTIALPADNKEKHLLDDPKNNSEDSVGQIELQVEDEIKAEISKSTKDNFVNEDTQLPPMKLESLESGKISAKDNLNGESDKKVPLEEENYISLHNDLFEMRDVLQTFTKNEAENSMQDINVKADLNRDESTALHLSAKEEGDDTQALKEEIQVEQLFKSEITTTRIPETTTENKFQSDLKDEDLSEKQQEILPTDDIKKQDIPLMEINKQIADSEIYQFNDDHFITEMTSTQLPEITTKNQIRDDFLADDLSEFLNLDINKEDTYLSELNKEKNNIGMVFNDQGFLRSEATTELPETTTDDNFQYDLIDEDLSENVEINGILNQGMSLIDSNNEEVIHNIKIRKEIAQSETTTDLPETTTEGNFRYDIDLLENESDSLKIDNILKLDEPLKNSNREEIDTDFSKNDDSLLRSEISTIQLQETTTETQFLNDLDDKNELENMAFMYSDDIKNFDTSFRESNIKDSEMIEHDQDLFRSETTSEQPETTTLGNFQYDIVDEDLSENLQDSVKINDIHQQSVLSKESNKTETHKYDAIENISTTEVPESTTITEYQQDLLNDDLSENSKKFAEAHVIPKDNIALKDPNQHEIESDTIINKNQDLSLTKPTEIESSDHITESELQGDFHDNILPKTDQFVQEQGSEAADTRLIESNKHKSHNNILENAQTVIILDNKELQDDIIKDEMNNKVEGTSKDSHTVKELKTDNVEASGSIGDFLSLSQLIETPESTHAIDSIPDVQPVIINEHKSKVAINTHLPTSSQTVKHPDTIIDSTNFKISAIKSSSSDFEEIEPQDEILLSELKDKNSNREIIQTNDEKEPIILDEIVISGRPKHDNNFFAKDTINKPLAEKEIKIKPDTIETISSDNYGEDNILNFIHNHKDIYEEKEENIQGETLPNESNQPLNLLDKKEISVNEEFPLGQNVQNSQNEDTTYIDSKKITKESYDMTQDSKKTDKIEENHQSNQEPQMLSEVQGENFDPKLENENIPPKGPESLMKSNRRIVESTDYRKDMSIHNYKNEEPDFGIPAIHGGFINDKELSSEAAIPSQKFFPDNSKVIMDSETPTLRDKIHQSDKIALMKDSFGSSLSIVDLLKKFIEDSTAGIMEENPIKPQTESDFTDTVDISDSILSRRDNAAQHDRHHTQELGSSPMKDYGNYEDNYEEDPGLFHILHGDKEMNDFLNMQSHSQNKKGYLPSEVREPNLSGIQVRREDYHYPYGGDSPFFIKLPGSPNVVPVFLQYEPVEVKYVENRGGINNHDTASNYLLSEYDNANFIEGSDSNMERFESHQYHPKLNNEANNKVSELGPDPFIVMDPPNLNIDESNQSHSAKIDESKKNTYQENLKEIIKSDGNISPVSKQKPLNKPVYPESYYIKNPDNSYSAVDTTSLTNPVFTIGAQGKKPDPDKYFPQYTPFPLTPNPPKEGTPETTTPMTQPTTETSTPPSTNTPISYPPAIENDIYTSENKKASTVYEVPSIEYSPIPSIDYGESFDNISPTDIETLKNIKNQKLEGRKPVKSEALKMNLFAAEDTVPEEEDFDIVALANVLHQNQKVWSENKLSSLPKVASWRSPMWDTIKYSSGNDDNLDEPAISGPWLLSDESNPNSYYSAFYSPEEFPGLDPSYFSYRKVPSRKRRSINNIDLDELERYIEGLPLPLRKAVLGDDANVKIQRKRRSVAPSDPIFCEWNFKSDPGSFLLVTFNHLSAPMTVDCVGAYIEVEKEANSFDARWCGNVVKMNEKRPHVIFAKSSIRLTVFDNGDPATTVPTGFDGSVEAIDLRDPNSHRSLLDSFSAPEMRSLTYN